MPGQMQTFRTASLRFPESNSSNDSRTETSSSTTKTIGVTSPRVATSVERAAIAERPSIRRVCNVSSAHRRHVHLIRIAAFERVDQGGLGKRLEQARDGTAPTRRGRTASSTRAVMNTSGMSCAPRISSF